MKVPRGGFFPSGAFFLFSLARRRSFPTSKPSWRPFPLPPRVSTKEKGGRGKKREDGVGMRKKERKEGLFRGGGGRGEVGGWFLKRNASGGKEGEVWRRLGTRGGDFQQGFLTELPELGEL